MAACKVDHTVQANDWLSKLADKHYSDLSAYPLIVAATNELAAEDPTYAAITNPDLLEIGWKLCIPEAQEGMMAMDDGSMADSMMAETMATTMTETMADGAMMDQDMMGEGSKFLVRLENIGSGEGATPLAPGLWTLHTDSNPLFTAGEGDRGQGLEALAEDGNPSGLVEALPHSGVFNTPVGSDGPGPLLPSGAYEFTIVAHPGENLSFASMYVQSNDLFFAPDGNGIPLFNADGSPFSGDVSAQIGLWDAGVEVNQMPGSGADQAPRQSGANSGADENGVVQPVNDGYAYPAVTELIRATITAMP